MRQYWIAFLCVVLGFSIVDAYAEEIVLHTVHIPPHIVDASIIPPPADFDSTETIYGLDADILRAAYATQGVSVRIVLTPWKRIMRDVEKGLILGAVSCRPVPSRETFAFFSDYLSDSANTFVTRRGHLDGKIPTLALLKEYDVAAVNGWSQTNILDSADITYVSVTGLVQGINVVLRRNLDVFMTERDSALFAAKSMRGFENLSFYDVVGLDLDHYSVCFSKLYPDAEKWRDVLNKGLDELKKSGKRDEIVKKYGFSSMLQ
ncbi:hypothetical protein D104_07330 [Marinomonas profundimaris]|uniref:Solute-binding protein family 3/N-terminal domain-containing protein n=1 Tax=Marinomonas profundimaris TaxID=1208321 RepID=W1S1H3_9GAMM|nr:hypothetical protein D104_07330 [Marinomonas profundimaris]